MEDGFDAKARKWNEYRHFSFYPKRGRVAEDHNILSPCIDILRIFALVPSKRRIFVPSEEKAHE